MSFITKDLPLFFVPRYKRYPHVTYYPSNHQITSQALLYCGFLQTINGLSIYLRTLLKKKFCLRFRILTFQVIGSENPFLSSLQRSNIPSYRFTSNSFSSLTILNIFDIYRPKCMDLLHLVDFTFFHKHFPTPFYLNPLKPSAWSNP